MEKISKRAFLSGYIPFGNETLYYSAPLKSIATKAVNGSSHSYSNITIRACSSNSVFNFTSLSERAVKIQRHFCFNPTFTHFGNAIKNYELNVNFI